VCWEGFIMFSKQIITVFWQNKLGSSRSDRVTSHLYEPRVHHRFEIWTPTSCWHNSYGLHLKGKTKMLCQNSKWLDIFSHSCIPKRVIAMQ
jgi:hypothetical protein